MSEQRPPTPAQVREKNLSPLLENDQDVQALMVTPQTGRAKLGSDLLKSFKVMTQEGKTDKRVTLSVWDVRSSVTSDARLSNYTKQQEKAARFYLKMQLWCLDSGLIKAAATANASLVAISEASLGREMALRNNLQEVRQKSESINIENKPEEKKFLGGIFGGRK